MSTSRRTHPARSVLHVITGTDRRGAELFAVDLDQELAGMGWESSILALAPGRGSAALDVPTLGSTALSPATLRALRRASSKRAVVVAHGSRTLPACASALLGTGVPFVYRNIGNPDDWATTTARRLRVRLYLRRASRVAALWEGSAGALVNRFGVPPRRLRIVPNARRPADYPPISVAERRAVRAELDLGPDVPVIAGVGALSVEKGFEVAIEAMQHLPDEATLILVGGGSQRSALEAAAGRLAAGRVRMLGPSQSSCRALAAADVLVVPSWTEGMPAIAIEAGMRGLPVVITDVGGARLVVEDGVTGLVIRPGRPPEMADALARAIKDAEALGAAARARCVALFDITAVAAQWDELLAGVVAG